MFSKVKKYLLIFLSVLFVGILLYSSAYNYGKNSTLVITNPSQPPMVTSGRIKENIANGNVSIPSQSIKITGNKQTLRVVTRTPLITTSGSAHVTNPEKSNGPEKIETIVNGPEAVIEIPGQTVNIHIERDKSPFKLNIQGYPEPGIGLGYNAYTVNLDKPFGMNANLGNLSVGPYINKSIFNNNTYVGIEASKSLGRVNLDVGYGLRVNDGTHSISGGVSVNFN